MAAPRGISFERGIAPETYTAVKPMLVCAVRVQIRRGCVG
jgi:hypothetical protein